MLETSFLVCGLLVLVTGCATAPARTPAFHAMPMAQQEPAEPDKSGTDPTQMLRTASFSSEFVRLPSESNVATATLRYGEPVFDGKASLRLSAPLLHTTATPGDDFGLGDVKVKGSWRASMTPQAGWVLGTELVAPTATEDVLGSGRWVAAPSVTYARFLSRTMIVAPALVHNVSFAGDEARADVQRTDFDLYVVMAAADRAWWVTTDLTVSRDHEQHDGWPVGLKVTFGQPLAKLASGAALNGYVRPGVGLGGDRDFDGSLEIGMSIVGF